MRLKAVIFSVIAGVLCAGAAPAERVPLQVNPSGAQTDSAQNESENENPASDPATESEQKYSGYQPDCEHPQDHNAADLCQQQRMAQAAIDTLAATRDAVGATRDQNNLIIFTLLISIIGTGAAALSAWAAQSTLANLDRPHRLNFISSTKVARPLLCGACTPPASQSPQFANIQAGKV